MFKKHNICPITYTTITAEERYSDLGLKQLSSKLKTLHDFPYTEEQQIVEASNRADKLSIQGVQPKLSARLNVKNQIFELCDNSGTYILKPQHTKYSQLPENEAITMHMASLIIQVPFHGLIYSIDGKFTYFIKRFDRTANGDKIPVEDFAQLCGLTRETKYNFSMEKIVTIIDKYCTFPVIEKAKLFTRVVFNYLVGNEDMHLKNYSLITNNDIVELSPGYDFINTTIAIGVNYTKEQIALPLNGKKNNLTKQDLIQYYGIQKLGLTINTINNILAMFNQTIPKWFDLIESSFLSSNAKKEYSSLIIQRSIILS